MQRELLEALVECSAALQRLHRKAVDLRRNDIARKAREANDRVSEAIVLCVPSQEGKAS